MIELLMLLAISPINAKPAMLAQFQPCVWPNPCSQQEETVRLASDFEICVWPRKCSGKQEKPIQLASDFEICVWPNKCSGKKSETLI